MTPILSQAIAAHARPVLLGGASRSHRSGNDAHQAISFRDFVLWPAARKLLRRGSPVDLGSRAFDLLTTLLRTPGELVSKEELLKQVWPSTLVEESNLRFQVARLRQALAPDGDVIKTVPGRGYLLARDAGADPRRWFAASNDAGPNGSGDGAPGEDAEPAFGVVGTGAAVVALIDPDPMIQERLSHFLGLQRIEVRTFNDAAGLLAGGNAAGIACVLLEVWLPGRSGLELQEELARRSPGLPLIFMSANPDVPTVVAAMRAGAIDFLTKPVRQLELLKALRRALAGQFMARG
jgi:DNA-binding response OmpR family regulator